MNNNQNVRRAVARHNQATALVAGVREEASRMVNEASPQNLTVQVIPRDTPDFLCPTWHWINRIADPDSPELAELIGHLPEEDRADIDLGVNGDDLPETLLKCLMKFAIFNNTGHFTSIAVFSSMMEIIASGFREDLNAILDLCKVTHEDCNITEFLALNPDLIRASPFDIGCYNNLKEAHYIFFFCMTLNVMGKGLNSDNYNGWIIQRTRSYSAPLALKPTDPKMRYLRPSQSFSASLNTEIKVFWQVRQLYFRYLWAMARRGDLLAQGCRITVNLLRNAEMTNISMIITWILTLNDILLGWEELAKYLPYLCAAYAKYRQIGPMAPWAKLILPPTEVQEFAAEKLKMLFSVAKALAAKYGHTTARQVEGTGRDVTTTAIVEHAERIVATAGGAQTIDTMAIRNYKLDHYPNRNLRRLLNTGALEAGGLLEDQDEDAGIMERVM